MDIPQHIQGVADRATCLHETAAVETALDGMAEAIEAQLGDKNPILLCVMIGGLVPLGHLLMRLNFPLEVDYVHASRYRGETKGGTLQWKVTPSCRLKDRSVLIVDDILDGGVTLQKIADYCHQQGARDVSTAVLVDKHHQREPNGLPSADFTGLQVEDRFVFGYGMDYKNYLRNASGIYVVAPEDE